MSVINSWFKTYSFIETDPTCHRHFMALCVYIFCYWCY